MVCHIVMGFLSFSKSLANKLDLNWENSIGIRGSVSNSSFCCRVSEGGGGA